MGLTIFPLCFFVLTIKGDYRKEGVGCVLRVAPDKEVSGGMGREGMGG